MKRTPSAIFAIAAAGLLMTLISWGPVPTWLATQFTLPLLVIAVGLPIVATLAGATPLRPRETARQLREIQRQSPRAATRAKKGQPRSAPASPPPLFREPRRVRLTARIGAALGLWVVLSVVLSPHPGLALLGELDSANGAALTLSLVAAWALGLSSGEQTAALIEWTILGAAALNILVACFQASVHTGLVAGRAPGLTGNPVFLGGFLIGALWLVIRRFPQDWRLWGAGIVAVAAGIQLSGSRIAVVLIPVAIIGAAITIRPRNAGFVTGFVVLGLFLGAGVSSIGNSTSSPAESTSTAPATGTSSVSRNATNAPVSTGTARLTAESGSGIRPRLEAWSMAGHAILDRPIQGWGPGRFLEATAKYRTLRFSQTEGPEKYFEDAHNIIVEYATTIGVIGLGLFLLFAWLAFGLSGWKAPLAGFALLSLATHLGEPQNPGLTPLCFLALGGAAAPRASIATPKATWVKTTLVTTASLVGFLLALGLIKLQSRPGPIPERANLVTARALLPFWPEPLTATSNFNATVLASAPDSASQALKWGLAAARREPYRSALWGEAGQKALKVNDRNAAAIYFQRAIATNRWSPPALVAFAQLLVSEGRRSEAIPYYERALRVTPDDSQLRAELDGVRAAAQ